MDIIDVLNEKHITYKKTNKIDEIVLRCTAGTHPDNSPSLTYNIEKNIFHCWSCGFKGTKRRFLKSIGVSTDIPFDSKQPYKLKKLKNKLVDTMLTNNIELPEDIRFVKNLSIKGISTTTLEKFKAFYTEQYGLRDYVCFPIYQFNKLRFIEGRNKFGVSDKPRYYRRPTNAKTNDILFPLDLIKDKSKLIIVEGITDMLNMWDKGYENTVCIFGVNNLTKQKLDLLDKIGTIYVEIMFDGDIAGQNGAKRAEEMLDNRFIQTKIIELPPGTDPGDLTLDQLRVILPKDRNKNVK